MAPILLLLLSVTVGETPEPVWLIPHEGAQPIDTVVDTAVAAASDAVTTVRYDKQPDQPVTPAPAAPLRKASPSKGSPATINPFERRLTALELALSTVVVQPPERWRFDRLAAEANALLLAAETESQRLAVRSVAQRLDGFRRIANRARAGAPGADQWRRPLRGDAAIAAQDASPVAPPVRLTKARATTSGHDAQGVLRPVVSKRANAPKYAVVDDRGRIAALVTPTAETEKRLKALLGKRVGLQGKRGYLTDLKREHVVAERVTPLDTIRR